MNTFLLILKILGILVSGASVIGSERLKKFELKLRFFLDYKNLDQHFEQLTGMILFPLFENNFSFQIGTMSSFFNISSWLREKYFNLISFLQPNIEWRPKNKHLNILVSLFIIALRLTLYPLFVVLVFIFLGA